MILSRCFVYYTAYILPAKSFESIMNLSSNPKPNSTALIYLPSRWYVCLTTFTSSLSIIGCVCIILVYVLFRQIRTFTRKLLLYLSIADFLTATGNILGIIWYVYGSTWSDFGTYYCKAQSAITIYSSCVSFFWTLAIGVYLNITTIHNQGQIMEKLSTYLHIVCWILPAIISFIALGFDVLGYDQSLEQATWCWIDPRVPHALFWQFFTGKAWELVSCLLTIILYVRLKIFLLKQKDKSKELFQKRKNKQQLINQANRKLTFVPVVFIALRFWGTLRFLLGVFAHDYASSTDSAWLAPLQGIGDSAQGFANFVLYCFFTEKVRNQLRLTFCGCIPKLRKVHANEQVGVANVTASNTNNTDENP